MTGRDPLEEEFRDFVAARSGALLRTAYLLAGDWATAEDLVQTALTKTYLAWKRLGGIEAVEPYARRVMVNTSTSWWRRRWHGERPTEVLPERAGVDEIEHQLDRDLLWRHLRALPARQRAVLVLRYYEDMSEAQTAALLDIAPGTVKSQTSRALTTLRQRLGADASVDLPVAEPPPAPRPGPGGGRRTAPAVPRTPAAAGPPLPGGGSATGSAARTDDRAPADGRALADGCGSVDGRAEADAAPVRPAPDARPADPPGAGELVPAGVRSAPDGPGPGR
ncbi:RNA polymerase sigma-70 factor, sigma-E family [Micromonospora nigra]|uniref:RNA polymerase sigma-70 factor, sigma-E family n=1 Tax=Micromonospora nigra TaxID=145857 RepID=A0A1C6SBW9_9ACTN|nr:SigE family RNA polymerase sigma factor [Micromonospora nigra]SCL26895.1 RNA polymerase sigma-70 factor, sigma-E family [Micromonospora nigra]